MKITTATDLRRALAKLDKVGLSSRKIVRQEVEIAAKGFVREIVTEWTPPAGPDLKGIAAKKAGEAAIARDIKRVIASPTYAYSTFKDPEMADYFYFLVLSRQYAEAQEVLRAHSWNIRLRYASIGGRPDASLHQRNRKHGKVPRSTHVQQIVSSPGALNTYIRARQKKVGLLAAGWLAAARHLKVKLPAWVERHRAGGSIRPALLPWRTAYRITNDATHGGANDLPRKAKTLADKKMRLLPARMLHVIRGELKKIGA